MQTHLKQNDQTDDLIQAFVSKGHRQTLNDLSPLVPSPIRGIDRNTRNADAALKAMGFVRTDWMYTGKR